MAREFLMGNEAIALGAIHAGIGFAAGYPGTPSTEVLETIAKRGGDELYVEWSVNEKAALEAAAGAAYAGERAIVTMKQVGLNVASDPLMSLSYVGVKGGLVLVVADDPGPISSQTEQDTRTFGAYSKVPVFDPSSPEEAYEMTRDAFELSEKLSQPVIIRPTTRVCHGCADVELQPPKKHRTPEGFKRDTARWVIFPRASYLNHIKLEERRAILSRENSEYRFNTVTKGEGRLGIASGGISCSYVREAVGMLGVSPRLLKIATPYPFPEELALKFLDGLDEVLVIEELDPVIERELIYICGKYGLNVKIRGKLTGDNAPAGENTVSAVASSIAFFMGVNSRSVIPPTLPPLPTRPPVLCAGCPHRASFYAVKRAMRGQKAVFCGDIGCYTLGNAMPLDMVDTCLCMGADITIAQGIARVEPDTKCFAFIGDSTFFASGITGVVNAVYNGADITVIVLDNSTTAMTGHQEHPGTGKTVKGLPAEKISIEAVLTAVGVDKVETVDPLDLDAAIDAVRRTAGQPGVKAIIFRSPCIAVTKPGERYKVDGDKCITCRRCITELGCPAITVRDGNITVEQGLCYGCGVCAKVCPTGAIGRESEEK